MSYRSQEADLNFYSALLLSPATHARESNALQSQWRPEIQVDFNFGVADFKKCCLATSTEFLSYHIVHHYVNVFREILYQQRQAIFYAMDDLHKKTCSKSIDKV